MTVLENLCQWLYDWAPAVALRESENVFPFIETVHVLGICLIVGTVVLVDLRLLGWVLRREPVTSVAQALLPWTWCGWGLMLLTGLPLFAAESMKLYDNPAFRAKLVLLLLAGANALLFHRTAYRSIAIWSAYPRAPAAARVFAATSISLWFGVIVAGRLIAAFRAH